MSKVSGGFQWLENETTGDPSGVRRASDGKEFNVPIYTTDVRGNATGLVGPNGRTTLQRMKNAMDAAWRANPYAELPYGPAPTWQASTAYFPGMIVRGAAVGSTDYLYLQCVGGPPTSAGSGGPTGNSPTALIADGTCYWQYVGNATATGSYPFFSTVTPTSSSDVTDGYWSFINWGNLAAMGLTATTISATNPLASWVDGNYTTLTTPVPKNSGTVAAPSRATSALKNRARFITNAKRWIAFGGTPLYQYTKNITQVRVNGRFLSEASAPIHMGSLINPGGFVLDLTKFDTGPKVIELYFQDTYVNAMTAVAVGAEEYVMPFNQASDYKMAIEGDSIFDNTSIAAIHFQWRTEQALGNLLGCGNVYSNTQGSTGVMSTNSGAKTNYIERLSDITTFNPDILVVGGSYNDSGQTSAARQTAMLAYLQAVRAAMPNVVIAILGSNTLAGGTSATLLPMENDWISAVASFNDSYTFLIPVYSATPALLASTAATVSAMFQQVAANGNNTHPTGYYNMHMCNVVANAVRSWVSSKL